MKDFLKKVRKVLDVPVSEFSGGIKKVTTHSEIIETLHHLNNLQDNYNRGLISEEELRLNSTRNVEEFKNAVGSIGIESCFARGPMILNAYSESVFEFLVSKMYNKIAAGEGTYAFEEAFRFLAKSRIENYGWTNLFRLLDQRIAEKMEQKHLADDQQKDKIKTEFYRKVWLSVESHQGQEELAKVMFNLLHDTKYASAQPPIPSDIDITLLKDNLKEYFEVIVKNKPDEVELASRIYNYLEEHAISIDPVERGFMDRQWETQTAVAQAQKSELQVVHTEAMRALAENNVVEFDKVVRNFYQKHKEDGQFPTLKGEIYRDIEKEVQLTIAQNILDNIEVETKVLGDV